MALEDHNVMIFQCISYCSKLSDEFRNFNLMLMRFVNFIYCELARKCIFCSPQCHLDHEAQNLILVRSKL